MNKINVITLVLCLLILVCSTYYIGTSFDILNGIRIYSILKQFVIGASIALQIVLCITLSVMIILQKSDDGVFKRSLNPLMYKADNVALHNNTKWFILAIVANSIFLQLIW